MYSIDDTQIGAASDRLIGKCQRWSHVLYCNPKAQWRKIRFGTLDCAEECTFISLARSRVEIIGNHSKDYHIHRSVQQYIRFKWIFKSHALNYLYDSLNRFNQIPFSNWQRVVSLLIKRISLIHLKLYIKIIQS